MKEGDKIICVNNEPYGRYPENDLITKWFADDLGEDYLNMYESYTISAIGKKNTTSDRYKRLYLTEKTDWFFKYRFISLKEYRKLKLEEIERRR